MHLLFVSSAAGRIVQHPRVLVLAERASRGQIVLEFAGQSGAVGLVNPVTELFLSDAAQLSCVVIDREAREASHIAATRAQLERDARLSLHTLILSGALVRNETSALLAGEGAHCAMDGLFLGVGTGTADNHTTVDHAVPHGTSAEHYKGILGGRSRGVFRGRVIVRPGAQQTDASQSNPNLLTSDAAEIDTRPQLEIYADDVKCSHGSTIGRLDPDALFYLRARGIDASEAGRILAEGFAGEILDALPLAGLADALRPTIAAVLREQIETSVRHRDREVNS